MRADLLRDADCYEELIKYMFTDFLDGFDNGMTTVADELRGFGETGISPFHVAVTISYTSAL